MEPYKYELDMDYKPADVKGKMEGIGKSIAGIYLFNKIRKISKNQKEFLLEEPEDFSELPEDQQIVTVNEYVFYEAGIQKLESSLSELLDRYLEHCHTPDGDIIDRALYALSLINYVKGTEEENGTEA